MQIKGERIVFHAYTSWKKIVHAISELRAVIYAVLLNLFVTFEINGTAALRKHFGNGFVISRAGSDQTCIVGNNENWR